MKRADYYDRFYDWSESTQASRLSGLTDFGPSSDTLCDGTKIPMDDVLTIESDIFSSEELI